MDIIITEWALQSYLELRHEGVFTDEEYWAVMRPDVELLGTGPKFASPKFQNEKFWSVATFKGSTIQYGYKMKWHNLGPGNVQLRLAVVMIDAAKVFLCQAYVKNDDKKDQREMAKLKNRIRDILLGQYIHRGTL